MHTKSQLKNLEWTDSLGDDGVDSRITGLLRFVLNRAEAYI
jgi:hypothetical protein